MRRGAWTCAAAVLALACTTSGGPAAPAAPSASAAGCRTEKLRFTREAACQNDGYLEFCVPKGNAELEARIRRAAPSATPQPEEHGVASCDEAREDHWVLPTRDPAICAGSRGEVTAAGWDAICRLAALPEIERIVPTIWLR